MAFDFFAEQDKDEQAKGSTPEQPGGQPISGTSGVVRGNEPASAPGQGTGSGSFTNLQSYIDANADRKFGQQVAGRVQGTVDDAQSAQDTLDTGFRSQADKGSTDLDQGLLDEAKANPTGVVSSADKFAKFQKQRDAQYGGPQHAVDANEYSGAATSTDKARQSSDLTKDEDGRKAYLDQEYGAGAGRYDYTPGMKKLDNLLIQNDPGSRDAFQKAQTSAAGVQDRFGTLKSTLDQYAQQRAAATTGARSATRGMLGVDDAGNQVEGKGEIGGLKGAVQSSLAKRQGDQKTEREALAAALKNRNASAPVLSGLKGQRGYNLDPTEDLFDTPNLNAQTVATKDQQARMAALSKLAGIDNTYLPDEALAGTMDDEALTGFNSSRFAQRQSEAEGNLNRGVQSIQEQANAIKTGPMAALEAEIARVTRNGDPSWAHVANQSIDGAPSLNEQWRAQKSAYDAKLAEEEPLRQSSGYYDIFN